MIVTETHAFNAYSTWIRGGGAFSHPVLRHLILSMRKDANNAKRSGEGRLRPSLIGDECDRKQVLSYMHADASEFDGNWYTWSGTFLHLAFQTWLLDQFRRRVRIEHQVRPSEGSVGVTGKADWYWFGKPVVLPDGALHAPHIGDYKTATNVNSPKRKTPVLKKEHTEQLLAELYTLGMERGYLVYQDRAHGYVKGYELIATDEDFQRMGDRLDRLNAHTEAGTLPDLLVPCRSHTGPYINCEFSKVCMSHEYGPEAVAEEGELWMPPR